MSSPLCPFTLKKLMTFQFERLFFLEADDFLIDAVVDDDGAKEALQAAPKGLGFR
jgi:hypothetical protein